MKWNEHFEQVMDNFSTSGAFLTVASGQDINTMTIGWGFIGYMWKKPCVVVVVRPQRYTRELIDQADNFTVSVPFGTMKKELGKCGSLSGRDTDKSAIVRHIPGKKVASPVVAGCDVYYECKRLYRQPMEGSLMPVEIMEQMYQDDYHIVYIGEIVEAYEK